MPQAPLMLGVSGLRGIVGESLTPEVAMRYAAAFGTWLWAKTNRNPYVHVARDGRAGGEAIYTAAISGLLATGCRVQRQGVAMTPSTGVFIDSRDADAALIVTASHNPQEWNGLKILTRPAAWGAESDGRGSPLDAKPEASAPSAAIAQEIIDAFDAGRVSLLAQDELHDSTVTHDVEDSHCLKVKDAIEATFGGHNEEAMFGGGTVSGVVVDSVNASGSWTVRDFFEGTPVRFVQLAGDNSGIFPHAPEPTKENLSGEGGLCDAVPRLKADIGFAQDPDADRLAIVDENGTYIGEEYTLVLAAEALLQARAPASPTRKRGKDSPESSFSPKPLARASDSSLEEPSLETPVICVNLSTSRMIDDVAQRHGARIVRTPVGEANVVEMMKELRSEGHDVILGGEGNGGVIWPKVTYVRDSLSAIALTLALMARTAKTVSQLVADIPAYAIVKRKQPLASKGDAAPAIDRIIQAFKSDKQATIDTQDGVRIDWPDRWVHVRASNTEPILRLIAESPSQDDTERLLDQVADLAG